MRRYLAGLAVTAVLVFGFIVHADQLGSGGTYGFVETGGGDISGPGAAVADGAMCVFDGVGGTDIEAAAWIVDGSGNLESSNANGPELLDASGAAAPTVLGDRAYQTTGIGSGGAADTFGLYANNVLLCSGIAAGATGDGLAFGTGGNRGRVLDEVPSNTNPVFIMTTASSGEDYGLGGTDSSSSLIAGNTSAVKATRPGGTGSTIATMGGIEEYTNQGTTLGVGVATFEAIKSIHTLTGDAGANSITTITTDATDHHILVLRFVDALVTLVDDDTHAADTIDLDGTATNYVSADDESITLMYDGTSWYEVNRSALPAGFSGDLNGNALTDSSTDLVSIDDATDIDGDALTSGGTDDETLQINQTLNDSGAAGGTDVYSAIDIGITSTDVTGWDETNFLRCVDDGTTMMSVDLGGNLRMGDANGPAMLNLDSSTTVPAFLVDKTNTTLGIGGGGSSVSMIAGGVNVVQASSSGTARINTELEVGGGGGRIKAAGSLTTPQLVPYGADDNTGIGATSSAQVAMITNSRTAVLADATETATNLKVTIGGGMFYEVHGSDPCAQDDYTEGGMFFNSVDSVPCYCNDNGDDLRFDGTTSCF